MLMLPKDPCHNPHCINNITYASRIANLAPYKSEIRNDLSIHKALVNYYSRRFPNVTNRIGLATLPDDEDSVDSYKDTLYNQVLKKRSKQQHVQPQVVEQFILPIINNNDLDLTRRRLPLNSSRSFKNQLNLPVDPPLSNAQERAADWKIKLNRSNSTLTHSDLIGYKERRHILPGYHDDNNNNNNGNSLYEDEPWNKEDCNSFAKQTQIRGVELKKNIRIPEFNSDTDRQQHTKQQIFINQNQSHHLFSDSANHNCHNKYFSHHKPGNNIDVQNNPSLFKQFVKHGREIKITDDNNNNLNFIAAAADDKLNNRHIDDRTPVVDNYNYAKCCGHICDGGSTYTKPCYSLKNSNGIISGTLKSYSNLPPTYNKATKTSHHLTRSYSVRNPDSNFGPKFLKPRQQNIVSNFLSHNNNYNCASISSTNTTTTHQYSTNQKSVKFVLPELTSRAMKFGLHSRKKSLPGEGEEGGMDFNCSPSNASFEHISLPETAPDFRRDETTAPHHVQVAEKINTIKSSPKFNAMEQGSIPTQFFSSKIGYHNIKINDTLSTTTSSPTLNIKFHDNSYYGLASQSPICADSSSTQKLKKRAGLVSGRHDDDEFDLNPTVQRRYSMIMKQRETALAAGLRNRTMGEDMTTAVLTGDLLNVRFDAQTYTSNSALVSDLPNTNCSSSGVVERDIPPPIPLFNHRNNNNNNHRRRGGDLPTPVVANTAGHPTPKSTADHHHHPYEYETADTALIHDGITLPSPGGWGLSRRVRQDKVTSIMSSSSTSGHSSMEDADIPKFSGIQDVDGNVNTLENVQDNKANVPSNNNAPMNDLTNRYSSTCSERSKTDSMYSASNPEKWSFEGSINSEREDSCNISEHYSLNKDREDFPVFLHTDTIHDYDDKAARKSSRCSSNKGSSVSTTSSCKKAPLPPPRNVSLLKQNDSPVTNGSNGAESSADSVKITPKPKVVSSNLVVEKRNQISIIPTKLNLPTVDTIFSDGTEDFLLPRISNQTSNFMFNREKIRPIIMDEHKNNDFVKDTIVTTPTFDRKGTISDISPEPAYRHGTTKIRPKFVEDFFNPNIGGGGSGVGVPPIPAMASFPLTKTLKSLFINHHPNPGSSSSSSSDSSNCSIPHPSSNDDDNIRLQQQNHQKIMSTSFHESCSAPIAALNHNRPSLRSLTRIMNSEKKVNCQSFYGTEEDRHHNHHHHPPSVSPDTLKSIRDISRYDSKMYHQHDNHTTSPSSSASSQPDEEECDENYVLRNLKAMPLLKRTDYYILKTK